MKRTVVVALVLLLQISLQETEAADALKPLKPSEELKQLRDIVYQQGTTLAELRTEMKYMEKENSALKTKMAKQMKQTKQTQDKVESLMKQISAQTEELSSTKTRQAADVQNLGKENEEIRHALAASQSDVNNLKKENAGGWNNNPSAAQFQAIFRHLMVRCGAAPSTSGNVAAQDETVSLFAVEMSSTPAAAAAAAEELHSSFANIPALVYDHSYLPSFSGLVENALVYISGFVVRQILRKLSWGVFHASLVTDAVRASYDQSYHLLTLKNNGGLMIPSEGTVKVVKVAERVIRQTTSGQAVSLSLISLFVWAEIGLEDVFSLKEHIEETQFGIDSHHFMLLSLVVSVFHKLRLHHISRLNTLKLQSGNTRKKLCKTVLLQGF